MHKDDANKNVVASIFKSGMLSSVPYVQCKLVPKISKVVIIMMLKSIDKIEILNDKCHALIAK